MKKTFLISILLLLFVNLNYSQSKEDVDKIVGSYDLTKIRELQFDLKKKNI